MLHMEHGHMLMNRHLEPLRMRGLNKRGELLEVKIITGSQTLQTVLLHEVLGGERVGEARELHGLL